MHNAQCTSHKVTSRGRHFNVLSEVLFLPVSHVLVPPSQYLLLVYECFQCVHLVCVSFSLLLVIGLHIVVLLHDYLSWFVIGYLYLCL